MTFIFESPTSSTPTRTMREQSVLCTALTSTSVRQRTHTLVQALPEQATSHSLQRLTQSYAGYFVAGGIASITSRTATAPLDRLKVYLIAESTRDARAFQYARSGQLIQASRAALTNFGNAWKSIWQAGGVRSLWAGNGLNIVKMLPEGAIKFGTYEVRVP